MKAFLTLLTLILGLGITSWAQDSKEAAKPTDADKNAPIPTDTYLKRGAPIGKAEKVSLSKVLEDPNTYSGKLVRVEGVIVRSCKAEGCWAELAASKDGRSVRVKMKDHSFFIPLQSAGALARAEGVFSIKTLSKEHVEHLIKDDGAKFDKRNPDGTVTEISFEATGIELRRGS